MNIKRLFLRVFLVAAIAGAAYLIYRGLRRYSLADIAESLQALPLGNLGLSLGFAAASYLCLGLFDALAVRYAGKPLALRRTAIASFCALSIGHNIGVAAFSSGAVRYRFYSRWGLSTEQIAKVIAFCGATVAVGLVSLSGLCLLFRPQAVQPLGIEPGMALVISLLCLAAIAAYVIACVFLRGAVKVWKWTFEMPQWRLALGQIGVGTTNFALVAACLHQLIRAYGDAGYLDVATAFVTANVAVVITHVPGGLGVLEATVMHLVGEQKAIGALIAFRVIYYFIPLLLCLPTLLGSEVYFRDREPEPREKNASKREAAALH